MVSPSSYSQNGDKNLKSVPHEQSAGVTQPIHWPPSATAADVLRTYLKQMSLYFVGGYVKINNIAITTFLNTYTCSQQTQKIVVVTFLIGKTYSREGTYV
jgi:hypothetical protein